MRRKMRATTDLAKKGTKFSSYLKRVKDELIMNMQHEEDVFQITYGSTARLQRLVWRMLWRIHSFASCLSWSYKLYGEDGLMLF